MDAVIKQAVREELRRHLNDPNSPTAISSSHDNNNSTDPKEHRIQVRWSHWNKAKCEFMPVKQKNAGENRYIVYTDSPSLLLGELKQKAVDLFFPSGKN